MKKPSKDQIRWKLDMEVKRFIAKGGVVQKLKKSAAVDYHPYDTNNKEIFGAFYIDSNYQFKGTIGTEE